MQGSVHDSNSIFFERFAGWQGLLAEANPYSFSKLMMRRPAAYRIETALCAKAGYVSFDLPRIRNVGGCCGRESGKGKYQLRCTPLGAILSVIGVSHVDFFSLDVEGAEMTVCMLQPQANQHVAWRLSSPCQQLALPSARLASSSPCQQLALRLSSPCHQLALPSARVQFAAHPMLLGRNEYQHAPLSPHPTPWEECQHAALSPRTSPPERLMGYGGVWIATHRCLRVSTGNATRSLCS